MDMLVSSSLQSQSFEKTSILALSTRYPSFIGQQRLSVSLSSHPIGLAFQQNKVLLGSVHGSGRLNPLSSSFLLRVPIMSRERGIIQGFITSRKSAFKKP